ncbi:MAG: type II secretion system F family protein [Proteobacteria bacterium]|nr:type II secretion system F family protein [Pseudomonadota bacterium]MBU1737290.1 type II secretion system F family protein [Pseudomonadota bacterium]
MPLFSYIAVDSGNTIKKGTLDEVNSEAVADRLMRSGLRPLEIKRSFESGKTGKAFSLNRFKTEKVTRNDIDFFTKQVSLLLSAGLSLDSALRTIKQHSHKTAFRDFAGDVERKLKEGKSFSESLAEYPEHFSPMYVNIVRAGEEGGILPAMLSRISEYQATFNELKQYIVSASIYPLFLLIVGFVAVMILITAILPRFEILFAGVGQELPLHVQIMIDSAKVISDNIFICLIIIIGLPFAFFRYLKSEQGKMAFDRFAIKVPVISSFVKDLETTRIFRTLEVLVNNGVHLSTALKISSGVAGNTEFQRLLQRATAALKEGQQVGLKLKGAGLLPDLAGDLLAIGEESGRVGQVCGQIADHYEEGLRLKTKRIIALIEPLFILTIALVAGYVVISMLSVILSINEISG